MTKRSIIDLLLSLKSEEAISVALRNDNLNNKTSELKNKQICLPIDIHHMSIELSWILVGWRPIKISK